MADDINPYNAALPPPSGSPFAPAPGDISEVVYQLDVEDLVELALHNHQRSRALRRQFVIVRVSAAAAALLVFTPLLLAPRIDAFPLLVLCFFALLIFLAPSWVRRRQRRLYRKIFSEGRNRTLLGPRLLRLTPQGLMFHSELVESTVQWPALESIENDAEYAYFYIASYQANIVPRRAFNDDLQFAAFVELARRYWRQATPAAAASV